MIGFGEWQGAEVESPAGLVDGDAVHDHFVVAGFASFDKEGRQAAALPGGVHDSAGKKAHQVVGRDRIHDVQLLGADRHDIRTGILAGDGRARGRHYDGFGG